MVYLNIYTSVRPILFIITIPTLNMRKWRLRDIKSPVQIRVAGKSYSWEETQVRPIQTPELSATELC